MMECRTLLLLIAVAVPMTAAEPDPRATRLLKEDRILVIAHRGYSKLAPENTLPAFDYAITSGADLVELDYHHSSDGVPIVMHDYEVDRTTDGDERWGASKIRVQSKTAAELQTLDAGAWFSPRFAGTRLPLLTEALDCIQNGSVTLIERKAGDAATCAELLRQRSLINQVIVQAFDWDYLKEFHRLEPEQILGALGPPGSINGRKLTDEEKALAPHWIAGAKQSGAQIVVWNRQVSPDSVATAHREGLKVWVYTINEPELAATLAGYGIDGIITDNPGLVWRALALRHDRE